MWSFGAPILALRESPFPCRPREKVAGSESDKTSEKSQARIEKGPAGSEGRSESEEQSE